MPGEIKFFHSPRRVGGLQTFSQFCVSVTGLLSVCVGNSSEKSFTHNSFHLLTDVLVNELL